MVVRIEWTGVDGSVRHGEVWSPGPMDGSVWVIPDQPREGEGRAVCVGLDGRQTDLQRRWSMQDYHELMDLSLADPATLGDLSALRARGGQLRVSLAPILSRKDTP